MEKVNTTHIMRQSGLASRPDILPDDMLAKVRDLRLWVVVDTNGNPVFASPVRRAAIERCRHHRTSQPNLLGPGEMVTSYVVSMEVRHV